jgi:hypothetical protein
MERAIGDNGGLQSSLQILHQPRLIDPGIDVIPRQRLATKHFEILAIQSIHGTPTANFHLPIAPLKTGF